MTPSYDFDVIVIGSGPGGSSAAIEAAKLGKRVALVEQRERLGGVWIHAGTVKSKFLRSAITAMRAGERALGLEGGSSVSRFSMPDLRAQVDRVLVREAEAIATKVARSRVALYSGRGAFLDPHTVVVSSDFDTHRISAACIVVATGSTPKRPPDVPFDGTVILDTDELFDLENIPTSLVVVGAGIIGVEYANMFAALGVATSLVDRHAVLLDFLDRELAERLVGHLAALGVTLRLGETVEFLRKEGGRAFARLAGGEDLSADCVLFCTGRIGNTKHLNLTAAGLAADADGLLSHDATFRTHVPHLYAVGDVVGFPALASTAMMQGHVAAQHLAGADITVRRRQVPYALYSIPEVAMIGVTEEELRKIAQPYAVGRARYDDTVTGQLIPESEGLLKLLFRPDTRELLGIHSIGGASAEIIHIGQAVMELGGTLDYFKDAVFNLPTSAESYRLAALDGLSKVS